MPKLTLTEKEKVNLELYINFLVHSSNPCEDCYPPSGWCHDCVQRNEYRKKLAKYDVADLLSYPEIKEYVDASVKLVEYRMQVESLKTDIHNLEKKIGELMNSIDLVKDSKKKIDDANNLRKKIGEIMDSIDDQTEFYCNNCKTRFTVPDDKCKIAFDGEGTLVCNVRKYYVCPKCTKICWHNRGEII